MIALSGHSADWDERLDSGANAFDAVRLALSIAVVLEHSYVLTLGGWTEEPLYRATQGQLNSGQVAVYLFFALSGFLVTRSFLRSRSALGFLKKRAARIIPGFILVTLFGVLIVGPLTASHLDQYFRAQNWLSIGLATVFLKPIQLTGILSSNRFAAVNDSLWTIAYEFDAYLLIFILGVCGWLRGARTWPTFVLIAIVMGVGAAMRQTLPILDHGVLALLISSPHRWPELYSYFFVGAALYVFRDRAPRSARLASACMAVLVLCGIFGAAAWALLGCGVYGLITLAASRAAPVTIGGRHVDLSYGIYLFHWPIAQVILSASGLLLTPLALFALTLPPLLLAAWLSWTFVEAPCLSYARAKRP